MLSFKTAGFVTAGYTIAKTSSAGGGLPNPSHLINASRIFGALNPASLASAIIDASNGSAPTQNAIRESVRPLITVVENAQLDAAMPNRGYGGAQAMTATAPTPVVKTPIGISKLSAELSVPIAALGSSAIAGGVAPQPTGNQGVTPAEALKRLDLGPEISAALKILWKDLGKATIKYNIEFSYAVYRHIQSGKVEYLAAPGEDKASTPFGPREGYDLLLAGHTHNRPTSGFSGFGFGNGHAAPGPSPDDWTVKGDDLGAIHVLNQRTIGGIWSVVIY